MKKMNLKRWMAIGLATVMTMSMAACGSSDDTSASASSQEAEANTEDAGTTGDLEKVVFVSTTPVDTFDYVMCYVGLEMGYFEEEGIELELQQAQAGNDVKMLASGEADFGIPGLTLLFGSIDNGMDIVAVMNQDPYNIFGVAYKEGTYSDWSDIVGSTMAVPAETLIPYGTPSFAQAGISTDTDINFVSLGDTRFTAVATGEADSVLTWTAEWGQMVGQGFDLSYMSFDDINEIPSNPVVCSRELLENDPELVTAFNRAYAKSCYFMFCNPEAAADIVLNACGTIEIDWDGAVGAAKAAVYQIFGVTEEKQQAVLDAGIGVFDETRWQTALDQAKEYGDITNHTDLTLADVYDESCVDTSWDMSEVEADAAAYECTSDEYKAAN